MNEIRGVWWLINQPGTAVYHVIMHEHQYILMNQKSGQNYSSVWHLEPKRSYAIIAEDTHDV